MKCVVLCVVVQLAVTTSSSAPTRAAVSARRGSVTETMTAVTCPTSRTVAVCQSPVDNKGEKVKLRIALYGHIHDRATERHLPYGITKCYLPPDTGERTPP